jgi:hypothetical protein
MSDEGTGIVMSNVLLISRISEVTGNNEINDEMTGLWGEDSKKL